MATLILIAVAVLAVVIIFYFVAIPIIVIVGNLIRHLAWKRKLKRISKMYGADKHDKRTAR